jgi:predicted TIM-barrel fold metal-dependent hydrolase
MTDAMSDTPLAIVSTDGHASPTGAAIREYLDPRYHERLDEYLKFRTDEQQSFRKVIWSAFGPEQLPVTDPDGVHANGGREGGVDPKLRLAAMDHDGIAAELLLAGAEGNADERVDSSPATCTAVPFFTLLDVVRPLDERVAGTKAYHRWLADYAAAGDGRLYASAFSGPCVDMNATVAELEWCAAHGHRGTQLPHTTRSPEDGIPTSLQDPYYAPLWAAAGDLELPLIVHAGWGGPQGGQFLKMFDALAAQAEAEAAEGTPSFMEMMSNMVNSSGAFRQANGARMIVWDLMLSGAFDRHPNLKLVFTEMRAGWIPSMIALLDQRFDRGDTGLKRRPSEYWADHVFVTASSINPAEVQMRGEIGLDHLMFGSDYPHPEGTWPNTHEWIRSAFAGCTEADARKILGENALRVFRFDAGAIDKAAARVGPRASNVLGDFDVDPKLIDHFHARAGFGKPADEMTSEDLDPLIEESLAVTAG